MKPGNISKQRILGEMKKLQQEKLPYLYAAPLQDDLYNWHFTFQGPQNTQFHQGLYHGQILLPYEYPFKPPDIVFMNKNGRFQTNTKICLTITQYHPEEWNSAWTIRTMLEAVISLFAQNVQGVGALTTNKQARIHLAKNSHSFVCEKCGPIQGLLPPRPPRVNQPSIPLPVMQPPKSPQKVQKSSSRLKRKLTQIDYKNQSLSKQSTPIFERNSFIRDKPASKIRRAESLLENDQKIERNLQQRKVQQKPKEMQRKSILDSYRKNKQKSYMMTQSKIKENTVIRVKQKLPIDSDSLNLTKAVRLSKFETTQYKIMRASQIIQAIQ